MKSRFEEVVGVLASLQTQMNLILVEMPREVGDKLYDMICKKVALEIELSKLKAKIKQR